MISPFKERDPELHINYTTIPGLFQYPFSDNSRFVKKALGSLPFEQQTIAVLYGCFRLREKQITLPKEKKWKDKEAELLAYCGPD